MKPKFKKGTEELAEKMVREAKKASELRRSQSVLLACKGLTAEQISIVTGLTANYIRQVWMKCRQEGTDSLAGEKRGRSRGRAHMTLKEEKIFLERFKNEAEAGELVTIKKIKSLHSKELGKKINLTVTWRLLKRHGWRKIVPRPKHPKHDPEEMKRFKEAIFPPGFDPYEG